MSAGPSSARRLSLADCIGLGINCIVGSGIFLLPGKLASAAGPSSALAFLCCGAVCVLIALCFAEVGGMFAGSGGPYLYAREAFGELPAFAVGWMSLCTGVVGYAAVSRGLAAQVATMVPGFGVGLQAGLAAGLILGLGAINAIGLKAGALTSDVLGSVKVLPLLAFAIWGLLHVEPARLHPFWPADSHGFARAVLTAVFACSGFEFVAVPAGDAADARHDIPRAIVGALAGATLLYALVQLAAVGTSDIAGSDHPLDLAAQHLWGSAGGKVVALTAMVSMLGFCSSSALVGPRLIGSFAEAGVLPARFASIHPRLGTPLAAVILGSGTSALAASLLDFDRLVDVSNVALFAQYLPTCLAVIVLRRTRPDASRTYRLPLGPLIPVLAMGASVVMLVAASPKREEWLATALVLVVGFAFYGVRRILAARRVGQV